MIRSLDDAIRWARELDDESPIIVVDWSEVGALLAREGAVDAAGYAAWAKRVGDVGAAVAPWLTVRFATRAAATLLGVEDVSAVNEVYQRSIRTFRNSPRVAIERFLGLSPTRLTEPGEVADAYLRPVWLHSPTRDEPVAVTLLSRVDEVRDAERSLRQSEARYRGIVEDHTDLIVRYRPDGVRTFVNTAYAAFFGATPAEIVGTSFMPLVAAEHRPAVEEKIRRLVSGEADVLVDEHLSIRHDGVACWTQWADRGIFDDAGRVVELQAVGRDVTARREAEKERLLLQQRLAHTQKMEALGAFAGGLAHDFNNTLTAILGYCDAIRQSATEPQRVLHYAEIVRAAGERASELTQNLLHLSRRPPNRRGRCDIKEVVELAGRLLRVAIPKRVALEIDVAALPAIEADAGQLTQAIVNLGLNARDAIREQGTIRIAAGQDGNPEPTLVLQVSDDGDGIPEEIRSHLFEPFFTTKPEGKGTGLGLAMVYACARAHDGRVELRSELGRGSTFELRLPLVPIAGEGGVASARVRGGNETILLVDDDSLVLLHSKMVLERSGYHVLAASGADEAMARFGDRIDELSVVVTDLVMSAGGGRELEQAFHARRPDLPILLVTGGLGEHGPGEFAAVLEKPLSPDELLRGVREVLDRRPPASAR